MYSLTKHSDNYLKTSGSSWQYHRDESPFPNTGVIDDILGNGASFKFKQKVIDKTENNGRKCWYNGSIAIFKLFLDSWLPLINWKINLILTWFDNCVLSDNKSN